MEKTYTVNGLSTKLEIDPRRLRAALRSTPPNDTDRQHRRRWYLSTAQQALHEHGFGVRRSGGNGSFGADPTFEAAATKVEKLAGQIDVAMAELATEPDVITRRKKSPPLARMVEHYGNLLEEVSGGDPFTAGYRSELVGRMLGRLLSLCAWELSD
jgi:hypothetical protein